MKPRQLFQPRTFEAIAMLVALQIVLSRFLSIQTPIVKFSFGFIPVMFAGAMFGAWGGAIVGGLSDILGAVLFPSGSYFPGYTLTAALSGAVYGFMFMNKHCIWRILIAYLITSALVTLGLNSFWIALQSGYLMVDGASRDFSRVWPMYKTLLASRVTQALIMYAVQVAVTYVMLEVAKLDSRVRALGARRG